MFRVDYALEQAGGKEFGSVFINERDNVALALVGAGLAKVRTPGGQQSPYYEELAKAAEAAEAKAVGIHTKVSLGSDLGRAQAILQYKCRQGKGAPCE